MVTATHLARLHRETDLSLQIKAKYLAAHPLWLSERERECMRESVKERERAQVSISSHLRLSPWTALWQTGRIRLPIIEYLD